MKLRSEFKAANASGSLWAEIAAHFCLRRSRRLNPALKPASRDLLALPPSVRCGKRKVGGDYSPSGDEEAQAKRARKEEEEEEDGFHAPANSQGDLTDAAESDSGQTGNENEAAWGEREKETTPLPAPISEVSTEEQGKNNEADPEPEQEISGEEKGGIDVVPGEHHDETTTLSPSIIEVMEIEKKDSTERVIAAEEEICVVNRSPTYSDVSLDDQSEEMKEDSEGTMNSSD
ncbi:unnamed protein product [Linum trigynum]|uniref:Uncharacterized protein n=1 Tax=Linum trigynum TaxID=586398 RepID=A0AAV2CQJ6_9ROSI